MPVRKRIEKYRNSGGAADLVRVGVLVPPSSRDEVLRLAERLRVDHRNSKDLQVPRTCKSYATAPSRSTAPASWTMSILSACPIFVPGPG